MANPFDEQPSPGANPFAEDSDSHAAVVDAGHNPFDEDVFGPSRSMAAMAARDDSNEFNAAAVAELTSVAVSFAVNPFADDAQVRASQAQQELQRMLASADYSDAASPELAAKLASAIEAPSRESLLASSFAAERASYQSQIRMLKMRVRDLESQLGIGVFGSTVSAEERSYSEAILSLTRGRPAALDQFRTREQKERLLAAALASLDGSTVIAVMLYLRASLSSEMLLELVRAYPDSVGFVRSYYLAHGWLAELAELLFASGRFKEAAMMQLSYANQATRPPRERYEALRRCLPHFEGQGAALAWELGMLREHLVLVERQLHVDDADRRAAASGSVQIFQRYPPRTTAHRSVCFTLQYLYFYHRTAPADSALAPASLAKLCAVSEKRALWQELYAVCKLGDWAALKLAGETVKKTGFLGMTGAPKRVPKSVIGFEPFASLASRYGAPPNVVEYFVGLIDDPTLRLKVGARLEAWNAVLDACVLLKSRMRVEQLRAHVLAKYGPVAAVLLLDRIDAALARMPPA